jgi:carbon-monoxide dehydrogenase medium subunit
VIVSVDTAGRIASTSITIGGVLDVPTRLAGLEQALRGRPAGEDHRIAIAGQIAGLEALNDPFYPSWYRKHVISGLLPQVLAAAVERARAANHE